MFEILEILRFLELNILEILIVILQKKRAPKIARFWTIKKNIAYYFNPNRNCRSATGHRKRISILIPNT